MSREKLIYPSNEIPHLWMHQAQPRAYNQSRNFYYEGATIFSYGSHFPIATHVTGKKGAKAILLNESSYSNTTSKQQHAVRMAIPKGVLRFEVPVLYNTWNMHEKNQAFYLTELTRRIKLASRARLSWSIESHLAEAEGLRAASIEYAAFFGLKKPKLPEVPAPNSDKLAAIKTKERAEAAKKATIQRRENIEREARYTRERAEYETKLPIQLQEWRSGARNHIDSPDWHLYNSGSIARPKIPTMLRIKGDEVETSQGARVPVRHARLALRMVRHVMETGQEFVTNGHTIHIGHYNVSKIAADGTLTAGCHIITWDEINRIAEQLDNSTPEVTDNESN